MPEETAPVGGQSGSEIDPDEAPRSTQDGRSALHIAAEPPVTASAPSRRNGAPQGTTATTAAHHSPDSDSGAIRHAPKRAPLATNVLQSVPDRRDAPGGFGGTLVGATGLPVTASIPTAAELARASSSRRRLWLRLGMVAMLAMLLVEFSYLAPFFDPAYGLPQRSPDAVPLSEVQPYGVNTFLHKEVDSWKREKTIGLTRDMGAGWIKQQFPWAEIEFRQDPNNPYWDVKNNQSAWTKFDNIVQLANQYGLRVIARIDSTPAWARDIADPKAPPSAEHMQDFGNFIAEFVKRYKGKVSAIQVWNEPNLRGEWVTGVGSNGKPLPANPSQYVEMLRTAYTAAKEVNPDVIILAAPLATTNEGIEYDGNMNEVDFLQAMYDAGAKQYFDAMAANAYGTNYAPEDPPTPGRFNFRRVEYLRAVMEKNGDTGKSVWFNEYGWNASPAGLSQLPWGRVTPEEQADYTVRGIEYARENWDWAGVFTIWYLRQVGDVARSESEYYFGLVDPDFVVSTAYRKVQSIATTVDRVATPGEWGPVSAAVQAPPSWYLRMSASVPGGLYVSPSAVGDSMTVTFLGNSVRLKLVPPAGQGQPEGEQAVAARYYVTIDGSTNRVSSELPRDAAGKAYIDVPATGQATEVVLARNIDTETRTARHHLTIMVGAQSAGGDELMGGRTYSPVVQRPDLPGIGSLIVESHRDYLLFGLLTALLLVGLGFTAWALRKSRPAAATAPEAASPARAR